jgi:hypothetical protein
LAAFDPLEFCKFANDSLKTGAWDLPNGKLPSYNDGHDKSINALPPIGWEADTILEIGQGADPPKRCDLDFIPESQNRIEPAKLEKAKFVEATIPSLKKTKVDAGNDLLRPTGSDYLKFELSTKQPEVPIKSLFFTYSESHKTTEIVPGFDALMCLDSNCVAEFDKPAEQLFNPDATVSSEK